MTLDGGHEAGLVETLRRLGVEWMGNPQISRARLLALAIIIKSFETPAPKIVVDLAVQKGGLDELRSWLAVAAGVDLEMLAEFAGIDAGLMSGEHVPTDVTDLTDEEFLAFLTSEGVDVDRIELDRKLRELARAEAPPGHAFFLFPKVANVRKVFFIAAGTRSWTATVRITPEGHAEIQLPEELSRLVDADCDVANIWTATSGELIIEFKKEPGPEQSD